MRGAKAAAGAICALVLLAPGVAAKPGDLIVGDTGDDGKIVRVKPSGSVQTLSDDPDLVYPSGTTFSAAGQLFAADYDAFADEEGAIFRVNPGTGAASPLVQANANFSQPIHLDYHPNGFLYVPDFETNVLARVNPVTGATSSVGDFTSGVRDVPLSIVALPNGSMVLATNDNDLLTVKPNGDAKPIDLTGDPVGELAGLGVDAKGRVLLTDYFGNRLTRLAPGTGRVTELAADDLLSGPLQATELANGRIAVVNGAEGVVVVNPANGDQRQLVDPGELDEIDFGEGISVEPPKCAGRRANIVGTNRRDRLKGSRFPDVIAGLGGDDVIMGLEDNDRLCGGGGDDTLRGGPGADKLSGGPGQDSPHQ